MKTEYLKDYSYKTVREFYSQGIVTQAQWEAYDFIWSNTHMTSFPYYWSSLLDDSRVEFWKLFHVLPEKLKKELHYIVSK